MSISGDGERLRLTRHGSHVDLRVAEKLLRGTRYAVNSWDKSRRTIRTLTATGKLGLFVEQQGLGQTEIADGPNELLEDRFDLILEAINHRHRRSLAKVAEWARSKQESEKAEIGRLKDERQRFEAQKKAEEENQRWQAFISEVEDWRRAELIRAYVAMLDSRRGNGGRTMDSYAEWREWAKAVADDLDHSSHRVADRDR